jgi:cation transport ATPase
MNNAAEPSRQRQNAVLIVPGMGSDHCAGLVSQSLKRIRGVAELSTSIANHKVHIEFDAGQTDLDALKQAVEQAGYQVARAQLSRLTFRKIVENLLWASAYNVAAIPIAALGLLHPMIGVIAMTASSLSVIANSLLLKRAPLSALPETQ